MKHLPEEKEISTIADLISFLQTLPQNAEVLTYVPEANGFITLDTGYMELENWEGKPVLLINHVEYVFKDTEE